MNDIQNFWIILYCIAWVVVLSIHLYKTKTTDASFFLYASFIFGAFCSYMAFNCPEYKFSEIRLFPFIYLFTAFLITTYPIKKYSLSKIEYIQHPSSLIIITISLFAIIPAVANFPMQISNFTRGLSQVMLGEGNDLYTDSLSSADQMGKGGISNLTAIFSEAFSTIGILFLFYFLTLKKSNIWLVVGLIASILMGILSNISMGLRGGVVMRLLTILITYFAFKRFLSTKINRIVTRLLVVSTVLIIIPIIAITVSRFDTNTSNPLASTYFYLGQSSLYFDNYGLDNNGLRYGDRTFPLFKRILGFENVPNNFIERRFKYPYLHVNDEVFISYIGDFTLDFGPVIAMLIFIVFSIWSSSKLNIRNRTIKFHQLILLHFILTLCIQGGLFLYSFADIAGNLKIIVYVIAYLWCYIDYRRKKSYSL